MSPGSSGLEEGATPEKFRFWFYRRLKAKRNEPKNQQRSKPQGTQAKTEREWFSILESSSLHEHYSWIYSAAWNARAFFLTGKTWSVGFKNFQRECLTATVGWLKSSSFPAPFTCYTFWHWAFVWHATEFWLLSLKSMGSCIFMHLSGSIFIGELWFWTPSWYHDSRTPSLRSAFPHQPRFCQS